MVHRRRFVGTGMSMRAAFAAGLMGIGQHGLSETTLDRLRSHNEG